MSNVQNPAVAGKETDPSNDPLALILTAIHGVSARLDALETRFEYLDRDVMKAIDAESIAVTDAEVDPPHVPTLAVTSDGRVLISITYLDGIDLTDREQWIGVLLSEAEAGDAIDAMSDAADNTAAHVGGAIIAKVKKRARGESGEGSA